MPFMDLDKYSLKRYLVVGYEGITPLEKWKIHFKYCFKIFF